MAIEKRFSAKLEDVEIVLVCPQCRARRGYALKNWAPGHIQPCGNCKKSSEDPRGDLLGLKMALRKVIDASDIPFEIRLEFTDHV